MSYGSPILRGLRRHDTFNLTMAEKRFIDELVRGGKTETLRKYLAASERRENWEGLDREAVLSYARIALKAVTATTAAIRGVQ